MADAIDQVPNLKPALQKAHAALGKVLETLSEHKGARGSSGTINPPQTGELLAFATLDTARKDMERLLYPRGSKHLPRDASPPVVGEISDQELERLANRHAGLRDLFESAHAAIVEVEAIIKPYTQDRDGGPNAVRIPPEPDLRPEGQAFTNAHDVLADSLAILRR